MSIVYFQDNCFGNFLAANIENSGGTEKILKRALLVVEGTHTDNNGKVHQFLANKIVKFVRNTNKAIADGIELPIMIEHSRKILDANGQLARAGEIISELEYKRITAEDLPDPRQTNLIGKWGIFAIAEINHRVEDVKSGKIKKLSPGIDLENDRIGEVSLVAFPAIPGPALFSRYGSTNYGEAKEAAQASLGLKNRLIEQLEIFFDVLVAIEAEEEEERENNPEYNLTLLKSNALDAYVEDVKNLVGIEDLDREVPPKERVYNSSPYDRVIAPLRDREIVRPSSFRSRFKKIAQFTN
ncbi:MAG: hypothetical protein ACRDBG_08390 [Waterburya sp.]